ncbi:hypothetical protein [Propionivibrio sp.]|uniref:hypothetical protein n=1 Tax=Propionivibrio sp. TaxID=2212460 RepID=UPI003BF17209
MKKQKNRQAAGFWKMVGTVDLFQNPLRLPPENHTATNQAKLYGYSEASVETGSKRWPMPGPNPFTSL